MPSQLHESHLLLFRNPPALAAELIRGALGAELRAFREARVVAADLTELQPAEYRADLVIELSADMPVHGIIVEVQLAEQGAARGRAALIIRQLIARFGRVESQVSDRVQQASVAELDAIGERLLTARTLQDAVGFQ